MKTFQEFIELAESSLPERGRRRVSSRGPSTNKWIRLDDRRNASDRVVLKKAGFKRKHSNEHPVVDASYGSTDHETEITTDKNQSTYVMGHISNKSLTSGHGRSKVKSTASRVRQAKALRKQLGGDRTPKKVHDVAILSRSAYGKNDPEDLISRGKSFRRELENLPRTLRVIGRAKPGDKVTATPAAVMSGENPITGRNKRDRMYTKIFGTKMNKKTGKTIGTMKG